MLYYSITGRRALAVNQYYVTFFFFARPAVEISVARARAHWDGRETNSEARQSKYPLTRLSDRLFWKLTGNCPLEKPGVADRYLNRVSPAREMKNAFDVIIPELFPLKHRAQKTSCAWKNKSYDQVTTYKTRRWFCKYFITWKIVWLYIYI